MTRASCLLVASLFATGCAATRADPTSTARTITREASAALARGDLPTLDRRLRRPSPHLGPDRARVLRELEPEDRKAAATALAVGSAGAASVHTRLRVSGEVGSELTLEREREGWRVDPESYALASPTPQSAIRQLIAMLERLDTEPALAIASSAMRDAIAQASQERVRGLRQALNELPDKPGRLQLQVEYGKGLFVLLRYERGQWRVEDFN